MFAGSAIKGQIFSAAATMSIDFKIFILVYLCFLLKSKEVFMTRERRPNS
jgi:hypothetical protein